MSADHQILNCGAKDCALERGACTVDAHMEFIVCPTCQVLRIPPENLVHTRVNPDPVVKLSPVMGALMSMRIRWLGRELPEFGIRSARIADIGCGDGQFLEYLERRGYRNSFGIEPDEIRAGHAQMRGVCVFSSRSAAEAAGKLSGCVDILIIWQVLEHIERPVDFIKEYVDWLAPSGVMIISVPNQASIQTRLFGFFSSYPDYGRHVWYHKSGYLAWFKRNLSDLSAALMRDRNYEYEIFSWVDSMASSITRQQNFVHRALKKGEGSLKRRLAAVLLATCLLPLALALAPLSLYAGLGSTLTFILRRSHPDSRVLDA